MGAAGTRANGADGASDVATAPDGSGVAGSEASAGAGSIGGNAAVPGGSNAAGGSTGEGAPSEGASGAGGAGGLGDATGGTAGPAVQAPCAPRLDDPLIVDSDAVFATLALDVEGVDEDEQLFVRYIGFTNRSNAGEPDCELELERALLFQILAATGTSALVPPPVAVDDRQLLYRIDLRDYGWDTATRVGSADFSNAWEAMVGSSPFAIPFVGNEADDVVSDTGSAVPFLFASAVIEQFADGVPPNVAPFEALRGTPEVAATLARLSAPVTIADVAGDLGLPSDDLQDNLARLDPALQPLAAGATLERSAYAPLFLPSACVLFSTLDNQPDPDLCD